MRVLVTAASRHGATDEIARQIGDELEKALDFPAVEVHVGPPTRSTTSSPTTPP